LTQIKGCTFENKLQFKHMPGNLVIWPTKNHSHPLKLIYFIKAYIRCRMWNRLCLSFRGQPCYINVWWQWI